MILFPEGGVGQTQAWMPTYVCILHIPQMIGVWKATVEWYIDRGKPKNSKKSSPSATLPTTNPTWITRARTRASAVRGRRLRTWAMARPDTWLYYKEFSFLYLLRKLIFLWAWNGQCSCSRLRSARTWDESIFRPRSSGKFAVILNFRIINREKPDVIFSEKRWKRIEKQKHLLG
jgi:hypothetical protein